MVMAMMLASVASAQVAPDDEADSTRVERPVASFFMAEVGSATALDTYLGRFQASMPAWNMSECKPCASTHSDG